MSQDSFFRQPAVLEMIATVARVVRSLDIDYFVIGAMARDMGLSRLPGYTPRRETKDVDIAIRVGSETQYEQVKQALVATEQFTADERTAIKLLYQQAIVLDLLPFGGIESEDREVRLDHPRPIALDAPGYTEVLPDVETITIDGVDMVVCPLEGIVLLKLIANDNDPSRTKDVTDIEQIVEAYFDMTDYMIFEDHPDISDIHAISDPDYLSLISARVIGRVMGRMLRDSPELRDRLFRILLKKTPNRYWPELYAGLEEGAERK